MSEAGFADHFSALSGRYREFRPRYPSALYTFLAGISPARNTAWDCGTGNGQAALDLAPHFNRVIATDPSIAQIKHARQGARVHYHVATAEQSGLAPDSADLITVAQAVHWFDLDRFYAEVRRVLRPGGVIAVWSYAFASISADIDAVIERFNNEIIKQYWPPQRAVVDNGYRDLPFPFDPATIPAFDMHADWNAGQLLNYLRTWSAVRYYGEDRHADPVALIEPEILACWGVPDTPRRVSWPLAVRAGRADAPA
jgi:SAM-dependent methyltransferase